MPKTVSDTAKQLYKRCDEEKLLRGKSVDAIVAACIFIACRQAAVPRTFREICELTSVPKKQIGQCYKALERAFNLQPGATAQHHNPNFAASTSPEDLMVRYGNHLDLPVALQTHCQTIASRARENDVAVGRSPVSIAGGAIYFTSMLFGHSKTLKEIGAVAGVSEGTIKLVYRLLYKNRFKIVPQAWIEEGDARWENLPAEGSSNGTPK